MWEPSTAAEKKFSAETHRIIAEEQLHKFVSFLEQFCANTNKLKNKFKNVHHITKQFIFVDEQVVTSTPISYLVHSDNRNLTRILESLGGVCKEISILVEEADTLFQQFIMYENVSQKDLKLEAVGKIIKSLQGVHCFIERVREVAILTLKQLCAILGKKFVLSSNTSLFPEVLNSLGDILVCLLKLDNLLDLQILKDHWFLYRKTVKNVSHSSKHNMNRTQLTIFDKTLIMFENDLLMSTILKTTIEKCFEDKDLNLQLKKCNLNNEVFTFINVLLSELEKSEDNNFNTDTWFKLNIFVVFHFNLFGSLDKKIVKRLLDVNKRISGFILVGNIMWYPEQFLLKHIHSFNSYVDEKSIENQRTALIQSKSINLPKEVNYISLQACFLLIDFNKMVQLNLYGLRAKQLLDVVNLLAEIFKLVKKINFIIQWILNIHVDKNIPITKSVLLSICRLIEILKCFKVIYTTHTTTITYMLLILIQHLSYRALSLLGTIKKQHTQDKSYKEHQLDVLSSLNVCEHSLKRPVTKESILIANLSLSASGLNMSNLSEIRIVLNQLEMFSNFSKNLTNTTNASFLLWHYNYMIPVYFSKLLSSKSDITRHNLLLNALTDISMMGNDNLLEANKLICENLYKPLEQVIEINLRLQTHLHLQLPKSDPFENYFSLNFLKYLPIPICKHYKNVKKEIEHNLSNIFYNLTSVALHDWKTYGEMRRLAYLQYGLSTVDDHLPIQTLGQGLDVLEIMRNINIFVSQYMYNLNSQIFIERESNNKHLNSINISHVANSIRTHGIGIMNTTVNFTYQFLRSKFYIFSQFIFDELIKSRLIKDIRFFNENKEQLNQMYPYERAEKFNIGIKKLGLNEQGESYLDLFRKVITQIGNAMGYIRLIRSGGRRCLAEGTTFIPDLEKIKKLNESIESEELPDLSKKSAQGLLDHLQSFLANIEEATEYFELLVKVFVPVLRNKENIHLKNFYAIIPPLTVNYVEYSLNFKEKLNKRNKSEYSFTDDGFALGLAYIIEILNQEKHLESLHWFHSVQRKLKTDKLKIKEQLATDSDNKLKQALTLSEKKVAIYEKEFRYLYYNFNSARLFFHL